uniref:Ubiquitinyl hydrolase 1 n=1 Tax=Ditylenchus dipsaci TaxID=166011 RepID=A0A915DE67_9BILA
MGCDATYEVVPLLFGQLWIIYARLAHTYAPMVFVLMNRKLESSYRFVLEKLKKLREKISPLSIAVDFEKAEWNAFEEAIEIIRDHSEQSEYAEELCLFLDYFEDTYVGRIKKRTERKKPRYAIEKWSVHQLVKKNEPRTNNGIESFNGQLLRTMACSHPTVWKLLTAVLDELVLADQRVSSYWSGGSTPRRNNAYLQLSERLRKTVQRYSTQPKIEYLKSIAHNLGGFLVEKKIEKLQPEIWRRKSHGIPAKGSSDVAKYGSTLHIIAATKLFDVNILTFNEDIGWTLYTPDVETGPSPELLQDAEKPTFALSYNGSHFDVILEI